MQTDYVSLLHKEVFAGAVMVYSKPSVLMRVTFLKNPINTETAMYKIKTLRDKWDYDNQTHIKHNRMQINN